MKVKVLVTQSYLTLCDPMDCSLPGCSVLGILQARILEWVAVSSSRGFSRPLDGSNSGQRDLVQPEFGEGHLCGMEENLRVRI